MTPNPTHAINYSASRATLSAYKLTCSNDPDLIASREKSIDFWAGTIAAIIERSNPKDIQLPEA